MLPIAQFWTLRLKPTTIHSLCFSLLIGANLANSDELTSEILPPLTLKQIMADPDWMGNSPEPVGWSSDGKTFYYLQKVPGHSHREAFRISRDSLQIEKLGEQDALVVASQKARVSPSKHKGTFIFEGDVYLIDYQSQQIKPLFKDQEPQSQAQFIDDNRISYFEAHKIFTWDLSQGFGEQIAEFKTQNDPDARQKDNYLQESQPRLLNYLKNKQLEKDFQKARQQKNQLNNNKTWYLGDDVNIKTFRLSPDAKWLILGIVPAGLEGKADNMAEFISMDGYVNNLSVRSLVGSDKPDNETFFLFDLSQQKKHELSTAELPGINSDPLAELKQKAAKRFETTYQPLEEPRAVSAYDWAENGGVEWSDDSSKAALMLFSYDNKDRWIATLDLSKPQLNSAHRLTNSAWVNDWTFNEFGWLPDNETLYFLSEQDGYSHLYTKKNNNKVRQLTKGNFEVSDLTISEQGSEIFFKANKNHPGNYEIYQVSLTSPKIEALTELGGVNDYWLSPAENQLMILHSTTTQQPELYLQEKGKPQPRKVTQTASAEFSAIDWQQPQILAIPSSEADQPIYSRYYSARSDQKVDSTGKKPAVIFIHGAGYLQNAHWGWSGYFREFMFHNLLTQQGYHVLDMDYRASKGYGRNWRTAIYQNMGTPELQDLQDGVKWLVENTNVDSERVGVYGGSYGGFMTFMALFKAPETFAAGAALRPVADWTHYNHGYTANILNTPEVDPEAYERSSPIEFAEGLNKPLLIAHGMVDDNVFFKDTVRLVQRLIELEKTPYFETAIYPVEPHGFVQPSSWLDEYSRIFQLFETHLSPRPNEEKQP